MNIARSCWEVYPKKPHDAVVKKRVSETLKFTIIDKDGDDNDNDNNNHDKDDHQNDEMILMIIATMMKIHDGERLKYYFFFFFFFVWKIKIYWF